MRTSLFQEESNVQTLQVPKPSEIEALSYARAVLNDPSDEFSALTGPAQPPFSAISVTPVQLITLIRELGLSWAESSDVIPVCLSDFDGTLTSGASGSKIFEYGVASGFFKEDVRPKINETLALFDLEPHQEDSVGEEFLRILSAFRTWSQDPSIDSQTREDGTRSVYKMLSWIYAGHTREEVHAFAERAFRAIGYDDLYLSGARELVRELASRGVPTAVISVKFQPIVEVAARYFDIPESAVMGMNLELDAEGRYTTEVREPVTFREGKDEAARKVLAQFSTGRSANARPLFAMGDSPSKSDQQMLEMAHIALVTEPQTPKDAEYTRSRILEGRRALIVDYERTVGGEPMDLFDRHLETQGGAKGRFL